MSTSLAEEYARQRAWRPWARIFEALPPLEGRTVLDLGCGPGDLAAELVRRGARVIGFDANEELVRAARARALPNARFELCDLKKLPASDEAAHGLWSSFAAAYFPDLTGVLATWTSRLVPGGWVALTEVADMFGHEPLSARTVELLQTYAREALAPGWYDFHMGEKLAGHIERAGLRVARELVLEDRELAFDGPALPEVVDAWRARFERLGLLRQVCGAEFERVRDEFLACLARPDHRSRARVVFCLAFLPG